MILFPQGKLVLPLYDFISQGKLVLPLYDFISQGKLVLPLYDFISPGQASFTSIWLYISRGS